MSKNDMTLLAFLEGAWLAPPLEMTFTAARGGSVLGTVREEVEGRLGYFEFMRFEVTDAGIEFSPFPKGKFAGTYTLTLPTPNERVLVFKAEGGQREVHFGLNDESALVAAVEGWRGDTRFREEWIFRRVSATAAEPPAAPYRR